MTAAVPPHAPPIGEAGSPDLDGFRAALREWLAGAVPPGWRAEMTGADPVSYVAFQRSWLATLRDVGLAAPHWPRDWGGGYSLEQQVVIFQEYARADAPRLDLFYTALYHAAATLLHAGTDEQQQRHLPAILAGTPWCQGFSEPEAGSDLAALRTRAVPTAGGYRVTGQKIWSSLAHHAEWCMLLVRTDPAAPRRQGITYLLLELDSPGVEVRPIHETTGGRHFNEIFLDDVLVPAANRIGAENAGWQVAQATLGAERGLTMVEHVERMSIAFGGLVDLAAAAVRRHPELRGGIGVELAGIAADVEVAKELVATVVRSVLEAGATAPEASIVKIYYSELMQRFASLGLDLLGPAGLVQEPEIFGAGLQSGNWMHDYLYSWGWTIGGGTNEILRNVVAERILGLPREPS